MGALKHCKAVSFYIILCSILTYGHESWVMTEKKVSQVQVFKCTAVNFTEPWILDHFSKLRDPSYIGLATCPE